VLIPFYAQVHAGRDALWTFGLGVSSRCLAFVAQRPVGKFRVRFAAGGGVRGLVGFGQVLRQFPQVVVWKHDGMPAVGLGHEVIMQNRASESSRRAVRARLQSTISNLESRMPNGRGGAQESVAAGEPG
jgi:hypothetical protein